MPRRLPPTSLVDRPLSLVQTYPADQSPWSRFHSPTVTAQKLGWGCLSPWFSVRLTAMRDVDAKARRMVGMGSATGNASPSRNRSTSWDPRLGYFRSEEVEAPLMGTLRRHDAIKARVVLLVDSIQHGKHLEGLANISAEIALLYLNPFGRSEVDRGHVEHGQKSTNSAFVLDSSVRGVCPGWG